MTRTLREQVLARLQSAELVNPVWRRALAEKVDAAGGFSDSMLEQAAWIAGCRLTPEERQAAQTVLAQLPAAVAEAPRIQPAAPGLRGPAVQWRVYWWWPETSESWLHPEDADLAVRLIPSNRVFRCRVAEHDGPDAYDELHYGIVRLRVKPVLHQTIRSDGFEIGDQVEVLSQGGRNLPGIGRIREMRYSRRRQCIQYTLQLREQPAPRRYLSRELRALEKPLR